MPSQLFTIINDNKLIGTIKLSDEIAEAVKQHPDVAILLTKETIKGDAPLMKFGLTFVDGGAGRSGK